MAETQRKHAVTQTGLKARMKTKKTQELHMASFQRQTWTRNKRRRVAQARGRVKEETIFQKSDTRSHKSKHTKE